MAKKFDWKRFEENESARILSEMNNIEQNESKRAAECPNNADESTYEAFAKASSSIIDLFDERTKHLR